MDVQVVLADHIPVLTLSGRFDASGAAQFDDVVCALASDAPYWVLDCTGVAYLSSIGLRSLVARGKTRRPPDGRLVLPGLPPALRPGLALTRPAGRVRAVPPPARARRPPPPGGPPPLAHP